ncbi:putative steryl acetyl hydrolase mug81 [Entomophthora muscae]|uniref:Steryl acetyl hydrolase mug81 n=1 Tax=Entomophthora muscae TaxID=34485 RepID=A0ACC2U5A6_9FUNG|nr:putative steryl acetyl hydrolase mug81 [Entomophthora muscae]
MVYFASNPNLSFLLLQIEADPYSNPDPSSYQKWMEAKCLEMNLFSKKESFNSGLGVLRSTPQSFLGSDVPYFPPAVPLRQERTNKNKKSSLPTQHKIKAYTIEWLASECNILSSKADVDSESFFESVVKILLSPCSDAEIESDLLELIGYDSFEFLAGLISHRSDISQLISQGLQKEPPSYNSKRMKELSSTRPHYGAQVSIMSETEKLDLKKYRKDQRKAKQSNGKEKPDLDPAELRRLREEALRKGPSLSYAPVNQAATVKYPNIYQAGDGNANSLSAFGTKLVLPEGTVRENGDFYDELIIPITKKAPTRSNEKTITLAMMDSLCKESFKGYASLNRVQSIVYPIAYQTNENMLLCAPTGAGKTDVAMLTILRTLNLHCNPAPLSDNVKELRINRNAFKIVYVAPMKALAAEIVVKLGSRLKWLGIQVKELTGDMQLTKAEIIRTQIIVTTPEKWDVVTRKGTGDTELVQKLKLLIIDEVHLLHDGRGSVIETIVARTLRQVESTQAMIRIVGLSATLPNYLDVAAFLRVSPYSGLFFFDGGFRPVPLEQHFVGVRGKPGSNASNFNLDRACFEKVSSLLRDGHQVMVFVHTRKDTARTAKALLDLAREDGCTSLFVPSEETLEVHTRYARDVAKSRNSELRTLFACSLGIHHAGMLRPDRTLTERMFADGALRVLCCTATLAWGVNLPAYAVVIRGTQVYDPQKGATMDLSILDVLQIFGRAGRPQYESHGEGYILTTGDKLAHYVSAITQQHPIESNFIGSLVDNLCAEICLGTVATLDEAVTWLSYTFLYVRMRRNPMVYGLTWEEAEIDPLLGKKRRDLVVAAARTLQDSQMIVFDEATGFLTPKDLGRIASNYYLSANSVDIMNNKMRARMAEADAFAMVSCSKEFENLKVRDEENAELHKMLNEACACPIKDGINSPADKVNVLIQSYISRVPPVTFALVSDTNYIAQNAGRVLRAVFEMALNRNWGPTASVLLSLCKSVERRLWAFENPLCQFPLPEDIRRKLEDLSDHMTIDAMRTMSPQELGEMIRFARMGDTLARCVAQFPTLDMDVDLSPITRTVLRLRITITPTFEWDDRVHGRGEGWWLWVEDCNQMELYHSEQFVIKKQGFGESLVVGLTIPVFEPLPPQIYVRAVSDRWIGAETVVPVSFQHLILPTLAPQHTDLLNLQPLPVSALKDPVLATICRPRFSYFNPVQTQVFHSLYHQQHNLLLGAPTGSGKTVAAELAMWAAFRDQPGSKVVYVAPLKALVRERIADWRKRLAPLMGKTLVELTGDITPDLRTIQRADIIITTPEKWDGISRGWQTRNYVRAVSLVIIDEIHLLGGDRGPILEVIVSRMNYISSHTSRPIRIVGLSTALANATDLAGWLSIKPEGLFNFRHSVRPVPLEVYIDGFSGKHYCPRMASMNRPAYKAIRTHSPRQPVIIFVSSRRQTRLTAQDLIAYCGMEENPRQFLHMAEEEVEMLAAGITDESLRMTLSFGIGLHHAGLTEPDRKIVEELFVNSKIQVLVATSTLAWGVNFPAHLVIVKGTEYYDAKTRGYVDYPITDILQMMGRAGRPQFDDSGIARVFVLDKKKGFFKKFLHEPFPVESSLHLSLDDHLNAEVAGGTIKSRQDALDYLSWTYLFQRVRMNPTYYGLDDAGETSVNKYLSALVDRSFDELRASACLEAGDFGQIIATPLGKICSHYYLLHRTIRGFARLNSDDFVSILKALCNAQEYAEHPVRHNEDLINQDLERLLPHSAAPQAYDSPHAKAFLLIQAHLSRLTLPIPDYITDTGSILDQAIRILQAMADVFSYKGRMASLLQVVEALRSIRQGQWPSDSSLGFLPHLNSEKAQEALARCQPPIRCLADLLHNPYSHKTFRSLKLPSEGLSTLEQTLNKLPRAKLTIISQNDQVPQFAPNESGAVAIQLAVSRKAAYTGRAYCPRFAKIQEEGFWVVLGDSTTDEVVAFKRLTVPVPQGKHDAFSATLNATLSFLAPTHPGKNCYNIFVCSDVYPGIDQVHEYRFHVA